MTDVMDIQINTASEIIRVSFRISEHLDEHVPGQSGPQPSETLSGEFRDVPDHAE